MGLPWGPGWFVRGCSLLKPFGSIDAPGLHARRSRILVKNFEHLRAALSLSLSRQVKVSLSDRYARLTEINLLQIGKNLEQPSTGNRGPARVATIPNAAFISAPSAPAALQCHLLRPHRSDSPIRPRSLAGASR